MLSERRLFCVCVFFTLVIAKCDRGSSGLQLEKEDKRKEGLPGSGQLLLLLSLLSAFDLLVDSIAQKSPDLGHEGTATASTCNTNDSWVPWGPGTRPRNPNVGKQQVKCTLFISS